MTSYRVLFYESERGWGSDSWYNYYDTLDEAVDAYFETNEGLVSGPAPDYYIIAQTVQSCADSVLEVWYDVDPVKHRENKKRLTSSKKLTKTEPETKQETVMNFPKFFEFLRKEADNLREIAAYNVEYGDRGAQKLLDQIEFWKAGRDNAIPSTWLPHLQKFNREADPDYATFKRLKEKFGE